jgi:hypothetical protein
MAATRDELIARLKRAGELELSGEDQAETDSYSTLVSFDSMAQTGSRRTTWASPITSRPFAQHSMNGQFVEA